MLVISRMHNESIIASDFDGSCVLTVLQVRGGEVSVLVNHTAADKPGALNTWTTKLVRDGSIKVGRTAEITLADVREEKARIGIDAPKSARVHRLEVWEAIHKQQRRRPDGGSEDGLSGSSVPPPSTPNPPSLDVRLEDPPSRTAAMNGST